MRVVCITCGAPATDQWPAYVVGRDVRDGGVLLQDEYGMPAAYYGRTIGLYVRRGCSAPACPEHAESAAEE